MAEPDLWYLDELVRCAAKVLARSADGDLYFVGRSPDSLYDLLSGALSGTSWRDRCHRVALSLWPDPYALTPAQVAQVRAGAEGRRALVEETVTEPTMREAWLRSLVVELRRGSRSGRPRTNRRGSAG